MTSGSPSTGQCSLEDAVINLKLLRETAVNELKKIIEEVDPGENRASKILVLDTALAGPLSLVVEIAVLKKLGIDRIFYLTPGPFPTEAKHIIYLIRPKVKFMKYISQHIKSHPPDEKTYNIFFVPRKRMMCEVLLQEEGVLGKSVRIGEYHLNLIPFDTDVLSMELNSSFKETSIDGDKTSMFYVAKSLMQLQFSFGIIPNILGKGANAQFITEMLFRMRKESAAEEQLIVPEIDTLILIDREVDLITPLCTQLTYEGLIDEIFGVFNGTVDLPAEMVIDPKAQENKEPIPPGRKAKRELNSNDKLFRDIRDLNFSIVGPHLNQKAKIIDEYYKERYAAKTITEIKDFMKKLSSFQKEHQSLRIHTNIAESVLSVTRDPLFRSQLEAEQNLLALTDLDASMSYIEDMIASSAPSNKVLRLLCLYSLTSNGIKEKQFSSLRRDILQTYGYKFLFTLENLNRLGMFKQNTTRVNTYAKLKKDFELIIEEMNEQEPSDIAYVYSGYAPISIRLVQQALSAPSPSSVIPDSPLSYFPPASSSSSRSIPSVMQMIQKEVTPLSPDQRPVCFPGWGSARIDNHIRDSPGGPAFHARQILPKGLTRQESSASGGGKVVLIFFIGGCTFTEISAIRFLHQKMEGHDFIVGTTKLINGNTMMDSVMEKMGKDEQ